MNKYYGLTPVFVDVNNDGKLDLVVANDSTLATSTSIAATAPLKMQAMARASG